MHVTPTLRYVLALIGIWMYLDGISMLSAQTTHTLTLEESIQYALDHNKTLQNARFDEYIAQRRVKEIAASGFPQLSFAGDLQYFPNIPTTILPGSFNPKTDPNTGAPIIDPETGQPVPGDPLEVQFGFPWQSTLGFSVNQLIFDGTFFIGLSAAQTYKDLAALNSQRNREETALAVSKAYYQALIAQEQAKLVQTNLDRLERLFTETKALNETGFAEKIDVDRLQISKTNLELEQSKALRFVVMSRDLLKFQMGMPIVDVLELAEEIGDMDPSTSVSIDPSVVDPSQRVEFALLEQQKKLESYNYKRYRAGYIPSLYGFGSYQWNAQRNEFNLFDSDQSWFPITVVGLQLNVPIFDGLRNYQLMQQSKLEMKKIDNQMEILRNSVALEVKNAQAGLLNAYTNLESYQQNVALAQKVFNVANIKYKEGVGSSLEVNEAETQLKIAESAYLSGLFEYLMAQVELDKVKGAFSRYSTPKNN